MGGKTTMDKRGHHICKLVNYEVRQKITQSTSKKWQGKVSYYTWHFGSNDL